MKKSILLLSVLIMSCSASITNPNNGADTVLSEAETLAYRDCTVDSDCIYATNGCCDCANGGQDIAVNKTKLDDFENLFNCTAVACTMVGAVPPCGSGTVSCTSGICEYTPGT
jgi:hypothetical protein